MISDTQNTIGIRAAKRILQLLKGSNAETLVVWIGENGCAVHPGGGEAYCEPVSSNIARRFIAKYNLIHQTPARNGVAFSR